MRHIPTNYCALLMLASLMFLETSVPRAVSSQDAIRRTTSPAELAVLVARSGYTGEFVLAMPEQLQSAFAASPDRSVLDYRSAFGFWMNREMTGPGASRPPVSIAAIDTELKTYAAARGAAITTPSSSTHRTVKDPAATFCLARLKSMVSMPVQGTDLVSVLATAVGRATGGIDSRGSVGSCVGTNQFAPQSVYIDGGESLENVLNRGVERFGSAVWVAIQGGPDICSVGVVHRAEGGGACYATLTPNLASAAR